MLWKKIVLTLTVYYKELFSCGEKFKVSVSSEVGNVMITVKDDVMNIIF